MRIAYVITRADEIGGAQVHVRDLASAMQAAGHAVTVLAGMTGALSDQLARRGVPFRVVPDLVRSISPHRDLAALRQLKALLKELRPDLVSTHSSKAGWLGRLAARQLRVPVIFTAHGWAFTEGVPPLRRTAYALAERLMSPLADRIITASEYDRKMALDKRIAPPSKITRIHNGVHGCMGRHRPSSAAAVRIVMIGRFSAQKAHASLLDALTRLGQLSWTLDLVGDGPLQAQTIALAESLGIRKRVRFLGARDYVCEVLHGADICTLISHWEGFPRSILEAMSVGLPVVASDVGGVSEAVQEGETGFLIPRQDISLLTERLGLLITSADLRHALGAVDRGRFAEEFQFELMYQRTASLYQENLRARRPRARRSAGGARGAGQARPRPAAGQPDEKTGGARAGRVKCAAADRACAAAGLRWRAMRSRRVASCTAGGDRARNCRPPGSAATNFPRFRVGSANFRKAREVTNGVDSLDPVIM